MCLGGHLALRASVRTYIPHPSASSSLHHSPFASPPHSTFPPPPPQLDPRLTASVCYFPTDIHTRTLGPYTAPNSSPAPPSPDSPHTLDLLARIRGEVSLIFGLKDT